MFKFCFIHVLISIPTQSVSRHVNKKKSHMQQPCSPVSRLNIEEAAFNSALNEFNTCCRGDVLHPAFYGDSVHVVYQKYILQNVLNRKILTFIVFFKCADSYRIVERGCRAHKQIHRWIWATDRRCQGRRWRSLYMSWRCLPL